MVNVYPKGTHYTLTGSIKKNDKSLTTNLVIT